MPDNQEGTETPAQRLIREKAERANETDLTGKHRDEQQEASDRQLQGYGSKEPLGRVLGDEETPSDLKTDGSRSPHDASSEGGSRQAAAHKQVKEEQDRAAAAEAKLRGEDSPGAVNVAPTEAQAASGKAAEERGETA